MGGGVVLCESLGYFGYMLAVLNSSSIFRQAGIPRLRILRYRRLEPCSAGFPQSFLRAAWNGA